MRDRDRNDDVADLPLVDEHAVTVPAPADAVWRALGASLPRSRAAGLYAAAVGARDSRPLGDPLVAGSGVPGFSVREAVPRRRLVLTGRHRFSRYALVFDLEERDGSTRLTARTRALFPGTGGRAYRALVIGSGAHRVLVRRWLRRIGAAAEGKARHDRG